MTDTDNRLAAAVHPGSLAAWRHALRLNSLLIAFSPVLVGTSIAWLETRRFSGLDFALTLAAALMLQVVANLQNDVGYTLRGADDPNREGRPRATTEGWLSVAVVQRAVVVASIVTLLVGLPLAWRKGWPIVAMGSFSLAGALAYMGGRLPIAYTPLGELAAFVFFGVVATAGSAWVQAGELSAAALLASLGMGAFAAAAIGINNHRDVVHDAAAGRRTFAVRFGPRASGRLFLSMLAIPYLLGPLIASQAGAWMLLPMATLPMALGIGRDFRTCPPGIAFNGVLFRTFRLELIYALLVVAGALAGAVS